MRWLKELTEECLPWYMYTCGLSYLENLLYAVHMDRVTECRSLKAAILSLGSG